MKKISSICCILIGALLAACTLSTSSPSEIPIFTITPKRSLPSPDHFIDSHWQLDNQPKPNENTFSVLVYGMKISAKNTLVICATTNDMLDAMDQPDITIQLRDDISYATLLSKSNLYSLGNIELWVMNFQARNYNSSQIYLYIEQSGGLVIYNNLIAQLIGPIEDHSTYIITTYKISTSQILEQDNYRISFLGWSPPPFPITPNPTQTPDNIIFIDKATLIIENNSTHKISYLAIQILSNGQIISELID
jgi:hypothetical protein